MSRISDAATLDREILALISGGEGQRRDNAAFESLALRIFEHQFALNTPYRRLCEAWDVTPADIDSAWAVERCPTDAWKEHDIVTFPVAEAVAVFESSGTTGGARPSRHYLPTLALYEAALLASFRWYVCPDRPRIRMLMLVPPPEEAPRSSLGHMLATVQRALGAGEAVWAVRRGALDVAVVRGACDAAVKAGEPLAVLGTAFSFVHACDAISASGSRLALPPGSRAMETGGYKGRSREVTRDVLRGMIGERLGIPAGMVATEYGMTEMGSQFYTNHIRTGLGLLGRPDVTRDDTLIPPPWVRTRVADPENPDTSVPPGCEAGLLAHVDLVNRGSCAFLLTADLGIERDGGFEVLGRASGAELRGCSLALEELRRA